eukprot:jgi/Picsp_1/6546/NSC_03889-R1_homoserine dehydrogenase
MALGIVLIGTGVVGAELLHILHDQIPVLFENRGIWIQIYGIANSRKMFMSRQPFTSQLLSDEAQWKGPLENGPEMNLDFITRHIISLDLDHMAIIDCTASDAVTNYYSTWLANSVHVVTPNKRLGSGPYSNYEALKKIQRDIGSLFLYEGTVGAGLPVLSTLKTLLDTGDKVIRILAICSGTLSYIFNNLDESTKFCDVVKSAKGAGFTEPDPRDDLAGTDVSRKMCILARECGSKIELEQVQTQNLVPPGLEDSNLSISGFLDALVEKSHIIDNLVVKAAQEGQVLRFVGTYDATTDVCEASLKTFSKNHAFANLRGTENIICFETERYTDPVLTIKGPGAGPAVTAAGVLGDLVHLYSQLS